jgi:hypothetical protein
MELNLLKAFIRIECACMYMGVYISKRKRKYHDATKEEFD